MLAVLTALLRLSGVALVAAAGWTVNTTVGLVLSGVAAVVLTYLPDGDGDA